MNLSQITETELSERKEMLLRFPNFVPIKADLTEFRGWLRLCDRNVPIFLRCGDAHGEVEVTSPDGLLASLMDRLNADSPELVEKIKKMRKPSSYLHELLNALNRLVERGEYNNGFAAEGADLSSRRVSGAKTFRLILDKLISTIGVESLKEVSKNRLTLTYRDMDMTYNIIEGRVVNSSIPRELLAKTAGLYRPREVADAFTVFKDFINKLQPFYDSLKSLDSLAWVVDPSDLRRPYRRVALEDSLALQITFTDPLQLEKPPLLELLGCPSSGVGFREILRRAEWSRKWDSQQDVLDNLRMALGDELRLVRIQENSQVDITCAICYAYRLGEQIPDVFCAHRSCRRAYHIECFRSWALQWGVEQGAIRAHTAVTGGSFAPCVYCEQPVAILTTAVTTTAAVVPC
ncbi:uncharacterized protein LOC111261302 isoform X1 [Varroa jacobsoni]|uniref:uncharacterized protein LOC111261302 isoform X1 n=1 Tax=Varroa jacobsoni TaxID=62625 RepID=UPI000BF93BDF|nr:uncharacterized protein LOC111261302 isoform X1 [Varroa jacobsoni]